MVVVCGERDEDGEEGEGGEGSEDEGCANEGEGGNPKSRLKSVAVRADFSFSVSAGVGVNLSLSQRGGTGGKEVIDWSGLLGFGELRPTDSSSVSHRERCRKGRPYLSS